MLKLSFHELSSDSIFQNRSVSTDFVQNFGHQSPSIVLRQTALRRSRNKQSYHQRMTNRMKLPSDANQLLDNFLSFRQAFSTLVEKTRKQEDQLRIKQMELNDARKKMLAMEQVEEENKRLRQSIDQLRSLRITEEIEEHERKLAQVVAEYEVKLRDAETQICELTNSKIKTGITSKIPTTSDPSSDNSSQNYRRWPKLSVDITSSSSANPPAETKVSLPNPRTKRKLFTLDRESIEDVI